MKHTSRLIGGAVIALAVLGMQPGLASEETPDQEVPDKQTTEPGFDYVEHDTNTNPGSANAAVNALADIADGRTFSLKASVEQSQPALVDDPGVAFASVQVGRKFALTPGDYIARVRMTQVLGSASAEGVAGAGSGASAYVDCEACPFQGSSGESPIVGSEPVIGSQGNDNVESWVRFNVPAPPAGEQVTPTVITVYGVASASAGTGFGIMSVNPAVGSYITSGKAAVDTTGYFHSITVEPYDS